MEPFDSRAGLIHKAIPAIMAECGPIEKARKNQQQNYNFRGVEDVYNAMQQLLAKHGVFCVPEVMESSREERATKSGGALVTTILKVRFTFFASDGSSIQAVTVGEGMDSGDKSSNKAMSAASKYAFFMLFTIPTQAMHDSETDNPQPKARGAQQKPPPSSPPSNTAPPPNEEQRDAREKQEAEYHIGQITQSISLGLLEDYIARNKDTFRRNKYATLISTACQEKRRSFEQQSGGIH